MFRAQYAQYAYRPELLERPSMARFVLLSLLLHAWMVLLFGDATGVQRDGAGWSRSFFATLERAVLPPVGPASINSQPTARAETGGNASRAAVAPTADDSTGPQGAGARGEVDVALPPLTGIPALPPPSNDAVKAIEFDKIPAIAVEVAGAVTPFSVAPIVIDSLAAPTSTAAPVFSQIPPVTVSGTPKVAAETAGFAVYVPPIIERAAVTPSAALVPAMPILPRLAAPRAEREFQPYTPPPVAVVPAPTPSVPARAPVAAAVPDQVAPSVTSTPSPAPSPPSPALEKPIEPLAPVLPLAPITPIAPIPPIAPITPITPITPLTTAPTTKSLETYRPQAVETPTPTSAALPSAAREASSSPARNDGPPGAAKPSSDSAAATAIGPAVPVSPAATSGTGAAAIFNLPLPPLPSPANSPAPLPRPTPRLDLDALRRQARGFAVEGSGPKTLMPFPTVAKETPKKDMERIFDKALKRPDCKEVYADLGLAAVVPLARDAMKEGGCKW